MSVNHSHLGMEITLVVFVDFNSRVKEIAIERPPGVMFERVFHFPLQQQNHLHAPPGRIDQPMAKLKPRKKVSLGQDDFRSRLIDRPQIGRFYVPPMAEIVS